MLFRSFAHQFCTQYIRPEVSSSSVASPGVVGLFACEDEVAQPGPGAGTATAGATSSPSGPASAAGAQEIEPITLFRCPFWARWWMARRTSGPWPGPTGTRSFRCGSVRAPNSKIRGDVLIQALLSQTQIPRLKYSL